MDRWNKIYLLSGHGGDGFLKFQDAEEVSSVELADAFEQMWQKRRYHKIPFTLNTVNSDNRNWKDLVT